MTWTEIRNIAKTEFDSGRLIGKEYATFLLGALQTQMGIDADADVKAAQIASMQIEDGVKQAQSAKDLLVKDAQMALYAQQKLSEVQRTSDLTYKNMTLNVDEHNLNLKKIELTNSQKLQADRQTVAFDDKKRVEQATQASGLVGMIYASGGDVPSDAWSYAKGKVDAI